MVATPAITATERGHYPDTSVRFGGALVELDDLILVSVDDHVVEPPGMFDAHLPEKWRDAAPRMVRLLRRIETLESR